MPAEPAQNFDLDALVAELRTAAVQSDAPARIKAILEDAVHDPARVRADIPDFTENDVILFEDDTVSIWHCRFMPGHTVPAHDHQMSAIIAVYDGAERNDFYQADPVGGIRKSSEVKLNAGEVLQIGPSAIHSVGCASDEPCCGIHVYLGNLSEVDRSLFDTERGEVMAFTDENYVRLTRPD